MLYCTRPRSAPRIAPLSSRTTALRDPAYSTPDEYVGRNGPSWLHRWRVGLGLPSRLRDEPDLPDWALQAYQDLRSR